MKPLVVLISSSSDDDDDDDELESECSSEDDGDNSDSDDQEYDEDEEDAVESDDEECSDNDDELCDKVTCLHEGSNDLQELTLNECKAYLRKHGLRLSGTKEECIQRIKEHWRLNDGSGESLYPRSSFPINCTGDACKGDVVLFTQRVYKKFDKVARRGNVLGKRTVAGRIVKESYGASKQQHTFTVEILWSKGFKKLPPLSTLLVKGRNLYRFRTFRQPWKSEAERSKVLGEKHKRGEAARHKRKLKKMEIASNIDEGSKRQKLSHRGPSRINQPARIDKQNTAKRRGAAPVNASTTARKRNTVQLQKVELESSIQSTFRSYQNRSVYSDHRLQEASSSLSYDRTLLPNLPPLGFLGYDHHNHGQSRYNRPLYRPPGYYHYNYKQPFPGYYHYNYEKPFL